MIELKSLALQLGDFAVEKVSLNLADGEYFVLMGRTGAGKTLVINPGESTDWLTDKSAVVVLDADDMSVEVISLK